MASLCEEESRLLADSRYRSYVSNIEKALKGFECTSEWADLISTLAKLNKVLLTHTKYPIVPRRIIISKRLAQCMHPALPSGVHLKALETYDIIFRCMGTNRLSQELFIYSAGLFPVFVSAAMNVRSALLTIYETHFVPLGHRLRPGLNGFLCGILPGLEEGSDHFERTSQLLLRVSDGVKHPDFFASLWECIAGNGSVRLPAISHITNCYNRKICTEDQLYILGTSLDMMVRGLCCSLSQGGVLVQRAALDFTLLALPLHDRRVLPRYDVVRLVSAAVLTLLRRDTSLNRRLYSWLLGSEVRVSLLPSSHPAVQRLSSTASDTSDTAGASSHDSYFTAFSKDLLVEGVICCFKESQGQVPPDLRPYKLALSLLDRTEIGPLVLDDVLLDMLRCLFHSCLALEQNKSSLKPFKIGLRRRNNNSSDCVETTDVLSNKGLLELNKSAHLVFSAVQPSYPWLRLLALLSQACRDLVRTDLGLKKVSVTSYTPVKVVGGGRPTFTEVCMLMLKLLENLPLDTQQQTEAARIMEVLTVLTNLIIEHLDILTASELLIGIKLCHDILQKLIPSVTLPVQDTTLPGHLSCASPRSSVATLNSLQYNSRDKSGAVVGSTTNVGFITPSSNVPAAAATLTPAAESSLSSRATSVEELCEGIVQIGIEANETHSDLSSEGLDEDAVDILPAELEMSEEAVTERPAPSNEQIDCNSKATIGSSCLPTLQSGHTCRNIFQEDTFTNLDNLLPDNDFTSIDMTETVKEDNFQRIMSSNHIYSLTSLYRYVSEFEKFFSNFVQKRIVAHSSVLLDYQRLLFYDNHSSKIGELKSLLKECLICALNTEESNSLSPRKLEITDVKGSKRSNCKLSSVIILRDSFIEDLETFEMACAILVDLSSIPTTTGRPYHFFSTINYLQQADSSMSSDSSLSSNVSWSAKEDNCQNQNTAEKCLPGWLVALLACCCCRDRSVQLQHTALAALMELLTLAQSDLSVWRDGGGAVAPNTQQAAGLSVSGEDGVLLTINIIPRIHPAYAHLLLQHTTFYQELARTLWSQLALKQCGAQGQAVELLLQLHAITSHPGTSTLYSKASLSNTEPSVVERELLAELSRPLQQQLQATPAGGEMVQWGHGGLVPQYSSEALQRWLTLWQLSRHGSSVSGGGAQHSAPLRLDRCLFLMLERVRGGGGVERSIAQRWLCQSLSSGDVARIVDPVLTLLLHPHTRRVGVQHVIVEQLCLPHGQLLLLESRPKQEEGGDRNDGAVEACNESLIYAISSVGGEVMYHVGRDGLGFKNKFSGQKCIPNTARQILALTSLTNKDKFITENINIPDYEVPYMGKRTNGSHISVLVNPFSQHPWLEMDDMTKINQNPSSTASSSAVNSPESERASGVKNSSSEPGEEANSDDLMTSKLVLSSREIAESIIHEILERVIQRCVPLPPVSDPETSSASTDTSVCGDKSNIKPADMTLHPLHSHMLLYTQLVDSGQCLYGLGLLKNIIEAQPKLSLLSLATTGVSNLQPPSALMVLMARHKRCVFGQGFEGGNINEMVSQYRSTMYLQVIITVCLYYLRSYYPRLPHLRLKDEHLNDNKEVQIVAIEVLVLVFTNLSSLVADSPRGLAPYVLDLLNKCKVQKCVLHCLLATVHAMRLPGGALTGKNKRSFETKTFTQELLDYNNRGVDGQCLASQETYLSSAMDLTLALVKLEDALASTKMDSLPKETTGTCKSTSPNHYQSGLPIPAQQMFIRVVSSALGQKHTRHLHAAWLHLFMSALPHMGVALPSNCLRLCSLLCVLLEELPEYYATEDVTLMKPVPPDYALTLISAITSLCHFCLLDPLQSPMTMSPLATAYFSPSHASGTSLSSTTISSASVSAASSHTPGQILFNLLHVFSPVNEVLEASLDTSGQDPLVCARRTLLAHLPRVVSAMLSLWSAASEQSERTSATKSSRRHYHRESHCLLGASQLVLHQIISFLSPVCHHHATHFIAAVSVVWQSLAEDAHDNTHILARAIPRDGINKYASLHRCSSMTNGSAINKMSISNSLTRLNGGVDNSSLGDSNLKNCERRFVNSNSLQNLSAAEASFTELGDDRRGSYSDRLFYEIDSETRDRLMEQSSHSDSATSDEDADVAEDEKEAAVARSRDALVRMVAAIRVLPLHLMLDTVKLVLRQPPTVEGFVQNISFEVSVLEFVHSYVAAASPQQLAACWSPMLQLLKEAVLSLMPDALLLLLPILNDFVQRSPPLKSKKELRELQDVSGRLIESISNIAGSGLEATTWLRRNLAVKAHAEGGNNDFNLSVAALEMLASEVACLLDVLYSSEEKDKVLPLLTQLMTHVTPYLRNHTSTNARAFLSCSRLVASLSEYQYTLKAWKKDVLELLLDPHAFCMPPKALPCWRTIVDNLYTHDKTMFKELLTRISLSQGGSLHLFSSKESEYETRAMLLKRLAFTILCSETDQYSKFFPDIQERVTEVSRMAEVVPVLVSAVLGLVAVLVVRMAPRSLVSLWPTIITEMVQVFLVMEQQLAQDTHMFSDSRTQGSEHLKRVSALDSRWVVSSGGSAGLRSHSHPSWLALYLAACKLLDLLLALPAHALPQFQMYRWAFVGPASSNDTEGVEELRGCTTNGDAAIGSGRERGAAARPEGGLVMKSCKFEPHVVRIARLMAEKTKRFEQQRKKEASNGLNNAVVGRPVRLTLRPQHLLLGSVASITTLMDLQPFFERLSSCCSAFPPNAPGAVSTAPTAGAASTRTAGAAPFSSSGTQDSVSHIENTLEVNFLEHLL